MSLGVMGSSAGASAGPVVGSYTGDGSEVTLTFGDTPIALIITANLSTSSPTSNTGSWALWVNGLGRYAYETTSKKWTVSASGNTLTISESGLIKSGTIYNYIAFF